MGPSSAHSDPSDLGRWYEALEFSSCPDPHSPLPQLGLLLLLPLFACLTGVFPDGAKALAGTLSTPFCHLPPSHSVAERSPFTAPTSQARLNLTTTHLHSGCPHCPGRSHHRRHRSRLLSPQPTAQFWSLLSVSKRLSTGAHSAAWEGCLLLSP